MEKTVKNRLIIAIISIIWGGSCFKIWCLLFSAMRPFEWWVTQHYQIMLSLSKYGLSEYAEKPHFWAFKPE